MKGINTFVKQRPDGSSERFTYAWRSPGAPRLYAERGTPEFAAEYEAACAQRRVTVRAMPARLSARERRFAEIFASRLISRALSRSIEKSLSCGLIAGDLVNLFRK